MEAKCYRAMQRAQTKMLRDYFSGVPFENLTRRYGYSEKKIKELAADYKQGKIDIFDNPDNRGINLSLMTHKEEVQLLKDKIAALEDALKLANIKAEGCEIGVRDSTKVMEELLADQGETATAGRRGEPFGRAPHRRPDCSNCVCLCAVAMTAPIGKMLRKQYLHSIFVNLYQD